MSRHSPRSKGMTYKRSLLGYDFVHFTRHALDRLKQRRITREDVYATIESPDETGLPTQPGRLRVRRGVGNLKAIDVVYELLEEQIRIITTFRVDLSKSKGSPPKILRTKPKNKKSRKKRRRK